MYFSPLCAVTSSFLFVSQFFPEIRCTRLFLVSSLTCLDVPCQCHQTVSQLYTLRNDLTEMLFGLVNALKTFWDGTERRLVLSKQEKEQTLHIEESPLPA